MAGGPLSFQHTRQQGLEQRKLAVHLLHLQRAPLPTSRLGFAKPSCCCSGYKGGSQEGAATAGSSPTIDRCTELLSEKLSSPRMARASRHMLPRSDHLLISSENTQIRDLVPRLAAPGVPARATPLCCRGSMAEGNSFCGMQP